MAKHRRPSKNVARNSAAATAVAAVTALANPSAAGAAEVALPGTDIKVDVPNVDLGSALTDLPTVPGADQLVASLPGQNINNYAAVVQNPLEAQQTVESRSTGESILAAARSKIGSPYVWGAAGPNAFDCSGLTSWAYGQVGKSIPRTSYAQASEGQQISRDQLQPGDIVVFYSGASHVGIYAGNGNVVHAVTQGTPLKEDSMANMPFHSAVRF